MIKRDKKNKLIVVACIGLSLVIGGCDDAEEEADSDADDGPDLAADFRSDGTSDSGGPSSFPPAGALVVSAAIGDFGDTVDLSDDDTETLRVAELIKGWNPDFIVTVGDNDYSDAEFEGTFRGLELGVGQYFHEFIGNYQGSEGAGASENAFFPVPGDHDYGDDCDDPRLGDYLDYFTLPEGDEDERVRRLARLEPGGQLDQQSDTDGAVGEAFAGQSIVVRSNDQLFGGLALFDGDDVGRVHAPPAGGRDELLEQRGVPVLLKRLVDELAGPNLPPCVGGARMHALSEDFGGRLSDGAVGAR